MSIHAWTIYVLRVVGLALTLWYLPSVFSMGVSLVTALAAAHLDHTWLLQTAVTMPAAGVVLGIWLVLHGARWLTGFLLRGLDGACSRCGYDLHGFLGTRCPECGARLADRPPAAAPKQPS